VSRRKTLSITRILQQQSLREARLTNLPLFHCSGKHQHGNSFGERLANAIEDTFAKGYERLLVIGNDTPDLNAAALQKAGKSLNDNQLVLGPATDGGVYLIGLTPEAYQREAFIQLAWETTHLQETFTDYALSFALAVFQLAPLSDIDDTLDFWRFLHSLPFESKLRTVFSTLLQSYYPKASGSYPRPLQIVEYLDCRSLRAPPVLV
jgi:glycosyltransferase A (GT-A) superfamily protein (DUF2064 family)